MKSITTKHEFSQPGRSAVYLFDDWFDPIEATVRERVRGFIEAHDRRRVGRGLGEAAIRAPPEVGRRR